MEPLKNEARAAIPEELPCMSHASDIWNVERQNNLWTEPKATLCPREMFATMPRKQIR